MPKINKVPKDTSKCPKCKNLHDEPPARITLCTICLDEQKKRKELQLQRQQQKKERAAAILAGPKHPCADCKEPCPVSKCFCKSCEPNHQHDFVEVLSLNDEGEVVRTCFQNQDLAEAFIVKLQKADGVTDLHKTLDTEPDTAKKVVRDDVTLVGCSWIGKFSGTRWDAIDDFMRRVKSKQIVWAVLVFKRGKRHRFTYDLTTVPGSKAWFCSLFDGLQFFLDDAEDHVNSVASLNKSGLQSILIKDDMTLYKALEPWTCAASKNKVIN